jgi:HEAT repeat protein
MTDMSMRLTQCLYCHKSIPVRMSECPYCHRDDKGQEIDASGIPAISSIDAGLQKDLTQLGSEDLYIRQEAAERIGQRGMKVVPMLVSILNEHSRKGLADIAKILGRLRDRSAIAALTQSMKIGNEDLRSAAVWALCQMNDAEVLPALLQEAGRQNPTVQGYIAHALAGFREARVTQTLAKLSADTSSEVAFQAVWSLGEVGDASTIPLLRDRLSRRDRLIDAAARYSLKRLGGPLRRRLPKWIVGLGVLLLIAGLFGLMRYFYK